MLLGSTLEFTAISATILINFFLGYAVYSQGKKSKINIVFFILAFSYALWGLSLLFYEYSLITSSYFWIKVTYFLVPILEVLTLVFSFIFPVEMFKKSQIYAWIYSIAYFAFSYWLLFFTDLWVKGVVNTREGVHTITGPGYGWWVLATWGVLGWAIVNFLIKSKRLTGRLRAQLWYLFLGFTLWGILVNIPDVILPIFFNNSRYFAISTLSSLAYTSAVAYSIIKHRFLDIRLVIARSVSYTLLVLILGIGYATSLFLVQAFIIKEQTSISTLVSSTFFALVIAYSFQPLNIVLAKLTDKIFFREKYDTRKLLHNLSNIMASTLTLTDLSSKVIEFITNHMRLTKSTLILVKKDQISVTNNASAKAPPNYSLDEVNLMHKPHKTLVFDELEEGPIKRLMREKDIGLALPLFTKEQFIGFLILGAKESGDVFFEDDVNFLSILGPEFSIALQNAQRFQEINQFNITLQQKVKRATRELETSNNKLKEADKQKDEFISIASHDLRSPLSIIKNNLWLAGRSQKLTKSAKESIKRAYVSNEHAVNLVNDMLNVSRIEMGRFTVEIKKFDLMKVAVEAYENFLPQAKEKGIFLTRPYFNEDTKLMIKGDIERVNEVFSNLIVNALKFTPEGGKISLNLVKTNKLAKVSVEDTGMGIKRTDIPKLFTKFGRLKNTLSATGNPGTGLGLYICKQIITLMKGRVWVESQVGKGSRFYFTLPLA